METRAVVASPMGTSGELTIWSATQIPHVLRVVMALATGIPENKLRVIAPDVGGGFGAKLQVYREEILATVIANRLGRPVKWTESRSENMVATHHGRDQIQFIEMAATREGKILGMKVELLANMGAYLQLLTPGIPVLGQFMFNGIYKMDAYDWKCTGVFTTTTPTDAYRGAGRPEATFALERIVDELAVELGMDPMELRRRNWIKHEEFPYTTISGLTYDSGNYEAATDRAMELFDYDGLRAEQAARRESNDPVQLGIGISTFTEMCGLAPSRTLDALRYAAGGWEHCTIRILPTGKVELVTGTSPHGQGHETAWSQIAADSLGIPVDDIEVIHGDTGRSPYGMDTYGSRSLAVGGVAILRAAEAAVAKARVIAAHLLEVSAGRPGFRRRVVQRQGRPGVVEDDPGHRLGGVHLARPAGRHRPEPVRRVDGRPAGVLLPARHPPVRGRGRHRNRDDEDPQVRRGRRHRGAGEPDDRRGADPRRADAGHRAGAVGGRRLRRGRQPDHRVAGGLPVADRG